MTHIPPLSLAFYTVPELAPPQVAEVAAATGFAHMGLRLLNGQPADGGSPLATDASLRRETMARMHDHGITALDANSARLVPETKIEDFEPFLAIAAEMGARHVLSTGNDPDRRRLVDKWAALAGLAGSYGLTVEIEFVPWMTVSSLADAADIVRDVGAANLGIALDALHFQRSKSTLADISAVPEASFRYMHLCDAPGHWNADTASLLHAAVHERLPPGSGAIELVPLLKALPRGIPMALEVPMTTEAKRRGPLERARIIAEAARQVLRQAYEA